MSYSRLFGPETAANDLRRRGTVTQEELPVF